MKRLDRLNWRSVMAAALLLLPVPLCLAQRIEVTIAATRPLTGHLILVFARTEKPEPRFQLSENYLSAQGFGVDVANLKPGTPVVVDATTFGNPRRSLRDLAAASGEAVSPEPGSAGWSI